jgi:hypothetical protein
MRIVQYGWDSIGDCIITLGDADLAKEMLRRVLRQTIFHIKPDDVLARLLSLRTARPLQTTHLLSCRTWKPWLSYATRLGGMFWAHWPREPLKK